MNLCATCGLNTEALPGVRLCRPCLEVGQVVLRTLLAAEASKHITPAFIRDWSIKAVEDVRSLSPMAHIIRGIIQGLILAEEVVLEGPERGPLIAMELAAMQALQEAKA